MKLRVLYGDKNGEKRAVECICSSLTESQQAYISVKLDESPLIQFTFNRANSVAFDVRCISRDDSTEYYNTDSLFMTYTDVYAYFSEIISGDVEIEIIIKLARDDVKKGV